MPTAWLYLLIAGLLEIGWPIGLKIAANPVYRWHGIGMALAFMAASGFCLAMAQRTIPMGTAYAVWTGIGAAGAFLVGILFYGDAATFGRWIGFLLIVSGVIAMKLSA